MNIYWLLAGIGVGATLAGYLASRAMGRHASGGEVRRRPIDDSVPAILSPGKQITDPDEAEALGMTAYVRRLRQGRAGMPVAPDINTSPYRQGLRRGMRGNQP
ncbi:hypothetical protein [Streptomyces reniochalinae]|uniref:hypothetical protein n=1 Tax=Streptomyces reniochalinae TaxID=2250578 RepID=UPI0011C02CC7|nr:hypothetical protein [Streptomyces reniochalinae]